MQSSRFMGSSPFATESLYSPSMARNSGPFRWKRTPVPLYSHRAPNARSPYSSRGASGVVMTTMNRPVPGLGAMAILLCCLGTACGAQDSALPVYIIEQTDSAHPGYRRTTVSTAGASYVNDFEEQSLQLSNTDPKQVVGRS